jgi:molybdopterin molybdotransferase
VSAPTPDWIGIPEATERMLAAVRPLPVERVALADALGRVIAETVAAPVDQPPWDNAAMDGFAVRADDVAGASRERPVELEVIEEIAAGAFPARALGTGQAARIMTGAPVPREADGVIRLEHTDAWHAGDGVRTRVRVFDDGDAGRNIRRRGEDVRAGDAVLVPGSPVRPAEAGVLAMLGRGDVVVHRRPQVAILSNGDELVDLDRFDDVRAGRRIINSNGYALHAALLAAGCEPVPLGIATDDRASIAERIAAAAGADALITSAGAAVGDHDLMKAVLQELGFRLDFWRVQIRPGSPFSFGMLDGMPVFGLPGNPVSVLVTFHVLVAPVLRRLQGRSAVHPATIRVTAAERMRSPAGLVRFLRARLEPDGAGGWRARLTGPQGSGLLTSMSGADALVMIPLDVDTVAEGEELVALPLPAMDDARPTPLPAGPRPHRVERA